MPTKEMTKRDEKVVQYLNDAYATERRLEIALQAHIAMTPRADYKKRLREHLKETKAHARSVERRIKALGGEAETVHVPGPEAVVKGAKSAKAAVQRAAAVAQGPLHAVRGTGEQERMLKNARTEYQDEAEEIATYRAIEALAKAVGDKETAKLARDIGREEKRMADFLVGVIDQLAIDVVHDEVPVAEIGAAPAARRTSSRPRGTARARATASRSSSKPAATRARAKPAASRAKAKAKPAASRAKAKAKPAASRAKTATRSTASRAKSAAKRS
jgi:ferritin-like metal-binding protein YciE